MSSRWNYKVVEVKPKVFEGSIIIRLEEELNRLGRLGWELVSMTQNSGIEPIRLVLKQEN